MNDAESNYDVDPNRIIYLDGLKYSDAKYFAPKINAGMNWAKDFLQSDTRIKSLLRNEELAKRLGYRLNSGYIWKDARRLNTDPKVVIRFDPSAPFHGEFTPNLNNPQNDFILINLTSPDIKLTSAHEALHRGGYGKTLQEAAEVRKGMNDFYKFKTKKLLNNVYNPDNARFNMGHRYLNRSGEAAVNLLHLGLDMKLPVGAKYPGDNIFKGLVDLYINNGGSKAWIFDHLNVDKPKRIWDALTGQYFSIPLGVGIGYETLKNQNKE